MLFTTGIFFGTLHIVFSYRISEEGSRMIEYEEQAARFAQLRHERILATHPHLTAHQAARDHEMACFRLAQKLRGRGQKTEEKEASSEGADTDANNTP